MIGWTRSISTKVILLIFLPVVILFVYLSLSAQTISENIIVRNIKSSVETYSQTINLAVSVHLGTGNTVTDIAPFLAEFTSINDKGIKYIALTAESGQLLAKTEQTPDLKSIATNKPFERDILAEKHYHVEMPVLLSDNSVGALYYGIDIQSIIESASLIIQENRATNVIALLLIAAISIAISIILLRSINTRFNYLLTSSRDIAEGDLDHVIEPTGNDELSLLGEQLEQMRHAIRSRVIELQESEANTRLLNSELSEAMDKLTESQKNLLQAEKLASLGSLVAAVAHELNTPIGNALGVATTMHEKLKAFKASVQSGLKKSTLDAHIENSDQALDIINHNIYIAAELIESFKHVAVDQTSAKRREFLLAETINDVLKTLKPTFKNLPIVIDTEIDEGIRMDSFPGALGQVITNIVNNSVIHAFEPHDGDVITLRGSSYGSASVRIIIQDNGKGISKANLDKIYDPFYTTRLGKGGSGLGLNIVYNLVSGVLGGTIQVESEEGVGTSFVLTLPLAPSHKNVSGGEIGTL